MNKGLRLMRTLGFKLLCLLVTIAKVASVVGVASASAFGKHQPQLPIHLQKR